MEESVFDMTPDDLRASTQSDEDIQNYGDYMTASAQTLALEGKGAEAAHCELLAQTCAEIIQERQQA